MDSLEQIIAAHPFFVGMQRPYLEQLVGCAQDVVFEPGEQIFRSGENADSFYLIREGCVALQLKMPGRRPITIQTVNAQNVLGWSWILPPYVTYYDARAIERTRAIGFDGPCLRAKCEEDKALGYDLLLRFTDVLRSRLRSTHLQLVDLYRVGP